MKKRLVTVFLLITLVFLFIFPVSANSPGPWSEFTVEILNAPEEKYYIDILIPLSPNDGEYSDNLNYLPEPSWESSPMVIFTSSVSEGEPMSMIMAFSWLGRTFIS